MNENIERKNPFFQPYDTPHGVAPFDQIRLEDYEEAMLEGIRREDEQIEKIINNPEKPTFDNTIVSVDDEKDGEGYYDLLSRVSTVFFNLLSAETNDEMDALAQKMSPILTKHANDIRLNERLFERIKYVHRHHRKLTPEEKMLLDNCYDGFVRSGALLDAAGKERLRLLTEEASMLGLQFSQNLLKENKAFTLHITDEAQLDGLPDTAREAAAQTAREQNREGWVITLDSPSYNPFMTYSTQRELRRQLYMAKNTECAHDNAENNVEICKRLINLRRELAQLLGHKTYADYVLKHRMAGHVRDVYKLLNNLIEAYKPTALKEVKEIEKMVVTHTANEGVKANMGNAAFVKELITSVVKAFNPQNASPVDLNLILPEALKAEVEPFVKNEIAKQFKGEVKVDYSKKMNGGFKVSPKDGGYVLQFTDDEFTQLIANYLRPATKKILFG